VSLDRDSLDRALAEWQARVDRVKANLGVLQDSPTFTLIQRGLVLTGRSKSEVMEPVRSAGELADYCVILESQVARAAELRASLRPFMPSDRMLQEIDHLLNGASVPIAAPQVPLAQRSLLDDPGQSQITLRQLVDIMTNAFVAARDAVTRYDSAMQRLKPALDAAQTQLAGIDARARELGLLADGRLAPVRAALAQARKQVLDDPLGASETFQQRVADQLQALSQQLSTLVRERDGVLGELARAQGRQRRAERNFPESATRGLREWLESIASTVSAGNYSAARIGLERWSQAATDAYGALEQHDEQLDLLKALRAKAQSLRSRGFAVPPDVDALSLEAENLLHREPPDFAAVHDLLQRYQQALRA
jgi:hypothetical protein